MSLSKRKITPTGKAVAKDVLRDYLRQNPGVLPTGRFPIVSDYEIATLYAGEDGPQRFEVPGIDAPASRVQLFVDKAKPFTGKFDCIDPATGLHKTSQNAKNASCARDWLNVYIFSYKQIAKQYMEAKDLEAKKKVLQDNQESLTKIYRALGYLAKNPNLSKTNMAMAKRTRDKIVEYMTSFASDVLAKRLETESSDSFKQYLDVLREEKKKLDGGVADAMGPTEILVFADTLLDIAKRNKMENEKDEIMIIKESLSQQIKSAISADAQTLITAIENISGGDFDKLMKTKKFVLDLLNAPKGEIKVKVSEFPGQPDQLGDLITIVTRVSKDKKRPELNEITKQVEAKYKEFKTKATFPSGSKAFSGPTQRAILGKFPAMKNSAKKMSEIAKETVKPVCETIPAEQVKEFTELYGNYHELMMLVLIFYYTGCSPDYDNKDITALAQDWLDWLKGEPFHVKVGSVSSMNTDQFDLYAPQSLFFNMLVKPWANLPDSPGGYDKTLQQYRSGYANLVTLAKLIAGECAEFEIRNANTEKKMSDYSERMKFLAEIVLNFDPVWDAIQKEKGGIKWIKKGNKVVREVDRNVINKCSYELQDITAQLAPKAVVVPAAPAAAAAPAAPDAPAAEPLPDPVNIRFALLTDADYQALVDADDSDEKAKWTIGDDKNDTFTVQTYDSSIPQDLATIVTTVNYAAPKTDSTLFIFNADGTPLDPAVTDDLDSENMSTLQDYFKGIGSPSSKYILQVDNAFNSNDLTGKELMFRLSGTK